MATATREFSEEYMELLLTLLEAGARTSLQAGHFVSKAVVKDAVKPPHWKPAKASDWKNHVELKDKGGKTLGFLNMASSLVQKLRPRLKESGGIELEGGGELSSEVSSGRMLNDDELYKMSVLSSSYGGAELDIDLSSIRSGDILEARNPDGTDTRTGLVVENQHVYLDGEHERSYPKVVDLETGEPWTDDVYDWFNDAYSTGWAPASSLMVKRPFDSLSEREKLLLASDLPTKYMEKDGEYRIVVRRSNEKLTPHFYRVSPLDEDPLVGKVVYFMGRKDGEEEPQEVMGRVTENLATSAGPQTLVVEDFNHNIERFELDFQASMDAYYRDVIGENEDEFAMGKSIQVFNNLDFDATAAYMNGAEVIPTMDIRGRLLTSDEMRLLGLRNERIDKTFLRAGDEFTARVADGSLIKGWVKDVKVDKEKNNFFCDYRDSFGGHIDVEPFRSLNERFLSSESTLEGNFERRFNALNEKEKLWLAAGIEMTVASPKVGEKTPRLVADGENAEVTFRDAIYDPSVRGKVVSFVGHPMVTQGNERVPSDQVIEVRGLAKEQELKSNGENTLLVEGFDGSVREYAVDRTESLEAGFNDFVRLGEPPFEAYQRPHVLVYENLDFEQAKAFIEQGSAWVAPDVDLPSREPNAVVAIGGTLYAKTPDMPPAAGEINQAVLVDEPEARELLDEAGWQWVDAENPNLVPGKPAYVVNMVETRVPADVDEVVLAGSSALVHEDIAESVTFRASGSGSVAVMNDFKEGAWQDINGWEKAAESKSVPFRAQDDGAFDPVYDEVEIRTEREDVSWR